MFTISKKILAVYSTAIFLMRVPPIYGGQHSMLDPAAQTPQGLNAEPPLTAALRGIRPRTATKGMLPYGNLLRGNTGAGWCFHYQRPLIGRNPKTRFS